MTVSLLVQLVFAVGLPAPQQTTETPTTAAELLPGSIAVTIEIPQPVALLKSIAEHPIHDRARKDKVLRKSYLSKEFVQAKTGLAFAEFAIGMKWQDAVNTLAGQGITLAFDPVTGGGAAILKSGAPDKLPGLIETLKKLANNQRRESGEPEIEQTAYRDVTVYKIDEVALAIHNDRVFATNNGELGKQILDALLDGSKDTLAVDANYKLSRSAVSPDDSIRGFVDMQEVHKRGGIKNLLNGTRSNPLAEFLLGGVFESLAESPYVVAGVKLDDESLRVTAKTPHQAEKVSEPREFYFGPKGKGHAPAMLELEGSVGGAAVYRDVSKMWLYAGDLFDQNINDKFAEAETALSTFFAGKDFVEEILAEIKPGWQLVVTRQDFNDVLPRPAIKVPSFALVGEFKDAKKMNKEMRRVFQSTIGFLNFIGATEGNNPQLDQAIEVVDGAKIITSWFVPTPEEEESAEAGIHFNFTPTLALSENRFVLASSTTLAKSALKAKSTNRTNAAPANFDFEIRGESLKLVLEDNREQLVANNMLEEGNTREEAEQGIGLLLAVVGWIDRLTAELKPGDSELRIQLKLQLRGE